MMELDRDKKLQRVEDPGEKHTPSHQQMAMTSDQSFRDTIPLIIAQLHELTRNFRKNAMSNVHKK